MNDTGLGKGLNDLLPNEHRSDDQFQHIPVDLITPDPNQPRSHFDEERLNELTQSIREQGLVEPVIVRPEPHEQEEHEYVLVAGERRWRASCQAELERIPALVRELSSQDALALSLVENIQRENLTPIEEARAYRRLMEEQNWSQQELANKVGRSRSAVANQLRLLDLPERVTDALNEGIISVGHGRALRGMDSKSEMEEAFQKVRDEQLSVRQTEQLVNNWAASSEDENQTQTDQKNGSDYEPDFSDLEQELEESVGASVSIESTDRQQGEITIFFHNPDEFDKIRDNILN